MDYFSSIDLLPRQALSLRAPAHMQLSITQGQAWLTRSRGGITDEFPSLGDKLLIASGERLVIESLSATAPLQLQWRAQSRPSLWSRLAGLTQWLKRSPARMGAARGQQVA